MNTTCFTDLWLSERLLPRELFQRHQKKQYKEQDHSFQLVYQEFQHNPNMIHFKQLLKFVTTMSSRLEEVSTQSSTTTKSISWFQGFSIIRGYIVLSLSFKTLIFTDIASSVTLVWKMDLHQNYTHTTEQTLVWQVIFKKKGRVSLTLQPNFTDNCLQPSQSTSLTTITLGKIKEKT